MTHICVGKLTIIGSDNGLLPERRQAIIWTNAGILLIGPLGTNFSEFLIKIQTFSFKKMRLKVSSAKRWPFCLGLNVLTHWPLRFDGNFECIVFKFFQQNSNLGTHSGIALRQEPISLLWVPVSGEYNRTLLLRNQGHTGNSLVLSGNKPLPERMLIQI